MAFATTTEAGVRIQGPSATLIYDDWYPALRTDMLRRGRLAKAMLLGIPLVLGRRGDGCVFAMRDSCPHRGIPLSEGWFDGNRVTCRYHGWEFEPCSGRCELIPSLTPHDKLDATRIYATAFPCEERDGHAWVFVPGPGSGKLAPGSQGAQPAAPDLKKFGPRFRTAFLTADLPCNVDHGIIGLMDPAHGPFVHQAWWWRSRASIREKTKRFEPIPEGFRMSAHAPSGNSAPYKLLGVYGQPIETTIDFVLPNRRTEVIRCGEKWFSSLTTITPVTASTCRIDVIAAWNIFYWVPFVTPIAKFFGARFVRQDQETMIQQAEGLKHNPSLMLIDDADKPAKWYFALKQARLDTARLDTARLDAAHSGTPAKHPMDGPVELHWRS
ncbi:MAG TPA: Rieske 2Fe-2S domain-containing protein [Terracidiphilus sp.]|jgi:phenylpropionate dioxygenase-like ring-hydroxylating dioxygenase large terminal subunit|nr:Rieske 2Fe-2S domain-containing protein [Terracidiphilus sp.]